MAVLLSPRNVFDYTYCAKHTISSQKSFVKNLITKYRENTSNALLCFNNHIPIHSPKNHETYLQTLPNLFLRGVCRGPSVDPEKFRT